MSHVSSPRLLLNLVAGLLLLLAAAAPVRADVASHSNTPFAAKDSAGHLSKQVDHASRRMRPAASVEEYFEVDDDVEQDFKPQPMFAHSDPIVVPPARPLTLTYRAALPRYAVRTTYSTGPPRI
jgi:hypothetical protein